LKDVVIKPPFIKLGQLLKLLEFVSSGGAEKEFLSQNDILVNGEIETRRGRKIYGGDVITILDQVYLVKTDEN
jgi:ribosome-associated protein YbcJ (S4-like RNA binding protein)